MNSLEAISFVKRGKNRTKVLKVLNKPMLPSEITKEIFGSCTNTSFNLVSRALAELKEKELVEVMNPDEKTGRIYQLTKKGQEVQKNL